MTTLLVFRHAHARRRKPGVEDHERPLSARGERDSARMGRWLADEDLVPGLVLASSAVRAADTARRAGEAGGFADRIRTEAELYGADPEDCLEIVRRHGDPHERVMLVGHNPTMRELVHQLGGPVRDFPPGAVAVAEADVEGWEELEPGVCRRVRSRVPAELA